jgi:hypothetical protein
MIMDIPARNKQFLNFMKAVFPEVELYGSPHRPKPVIKKEDGRYYVLPCYVNNYELILLDSVIDGRELSRLRLKWEMEDEELHKLEWWKSAEIKDKRCYFIRLADEEVFLNENMIQNSITQSGEEPSFSFSQKKIYLNYKDAINELERLPALRDNLVIV